MYQNRNNKVFDDAEQQQHELVGNVSSENVGDENDMSQLAVADPGGAGEQASKRKRHHRHTQLQINELEAFYKENAHPDEKQRKEIGRVLGMEVLQVKFWFQNKRTQMKSNCERSENNRLKKENANLRAENARYRDALTNSSCPSCGGPSAPGQLSFDEQQLTIQNANLRQQIEKLSALVGEKSLGSSSVTASMANEQFVVEPPPPLPSPALALPTESQKNRIVEIAVDAMEEFTWLALAGNPLWLPSPNPAAVSEILDQDEYLKRFPARAIDPKPFPFRTEASRESILLLAHPINLVHIIMDVNQWSSFFCGIVARAMTHQVLSSGVQGDYTGPFLQLMSAEFQVPSPLVPTRSNYFVRYCKQFPDKTLWAVVDVSLDKLLRPGATISNRRLPSGCLIQLLGNGYSKVTWVEHVQVDAGAVVHDIYKVLINSGLAFGAKRWVVSLDRQLERLASFTGDNIPTEELSALSSVEGRKGILRVAERMVRNYCNGVGASTVHAWRSLFPNGYDDDDVRVVCRKTYSINNPGKPLGIVLSAATSFWLPIPPNTLFDFLRNVDLRNLWDILSNGDQVQEVAHISNGRDPRNCVSLLRVISEDPSRNSTLILQECYNDSLGCFVVYSPINVSAVERILNGAQPDYVALLPAGFAILPDGPGPNVNNGGGPISGVGSGGCLLTIALQVLVNCTPVQKLSLGSVTKVNALIHVTAQRIKQLIMPHATQNG